MEEMPILLKLVMVMQALVLIVANGAEDQSYWKSIAEDDILAAVNQKLNTGVAKNVILFVGDGMGPTTVTSSRIHGKTEKGHLSFEKLPHIGVLKTYSANKLVPDSCSTATALFCGAKANHKTAGVDASVPYQDCEASLKEAARLESIFSWAQAAGKSTGFVTTTRVTHATPSALYAHTPNRKWECEATMPPNAAKCKDIARQLVEDEPGKNIQVVMGGGRQCLVSNQTGSHADPIDTWACHSKDGRDLIQKWKLDKVGRGSSYAVVSNNEELDGVDLNTEYVLGIFANGHLKMNHERDHGAKGMPSLTDMTEKAVQLLQKNPEGFVLMVEGGLIDFAHHRGHARQALEETLQFSDAIQTVLEMTQQESDKTLIIVTSDHAHSLVFTGYPDRTLSILDIAQKSKINGVPYTSLLYGTGGPDNYQFNVLDEQIVRRNPQLDDTGGYQYAQQAVVLTDEVTHAGTDVLVYATGPMSHLFQSVHEQTYVAYVISYAARIGPFKDRNSCGKIEGRSGIIVVQLIITVLLKVAVMSR